MKTDSQLQDDVMADLKWEPAVHAARIGVEVKDGVSTLAGEVGSYAGKRQGERIALLVAGVKALAIDMTVKVTQLGKHTDGDIASPAKNVICWSRVLPADAIQVMVEDGPITLSGSVPWRFQKTDASDKVLSLLGAMGVSNEISIKPIHLATTSALQR